MYATDYLESKVLNVLNNITFPAPESVYVGLFITNPGDEGKGIEVKYEGYERVKIDFTTPAEKNGNISIENEKNIAFNKATQDAGTAGYLAFFDNKVAGNMLAYAKLTEDLEIKSGEAPILVKGEVVIWLTGQMSKAYQKKVLNLFRGYSIDGVTPYLALFNGDVEDGGSELLADNYRRVAVEFTSPENVISGQTVISNNTELVFPRPSTNWGNWTHTVLMDNNAHGEPIFISYNGTIKELKKGHMPRAEKGALRFAIN